MLKIFIAQHPTEAHLVKAILELEGIAAVVRGELLFTLRGETVMTPDTLPSVWVADDDAASAIEILAPFRAAGQRPGPPLQWICRGCGERVDRHFELCWNCGESR